MFLAFYKYKDFKSEGRKPTFISSVSGYEEEYYLGKSSWSGNANDWDQRFEVGDVVADPSGSWEPGTAEAYIDSQVATITSNLANETVARQTGDQSLQTQINAEATTRANVDNTKADKATTLAGYGITNAYTKTEVNDLVDTPHQNYVTVQTYSDLPASGSADTIYRVSNYDGSVPEINVTKYSEYAWQGTQYIFLCVKSQIDEVFDITVYHSNTTYSDLAAALGTDGDNIPPTLRRGGMSVKYVQTSDNKYVQFRYTGTETTGTPNPFFDTANWQGVDDVPTAGSDNLVKSGGVYNTVYPNNPIALNGFVFCQRGAFNLQGKLTVSNTRARIISKHISKISLKGQTNLKFAVYGNNSGIGNAVNALTGGWTTSDFINSSEYEYIFIMVALKSDTSEITSSPSLYIEFTQPHNTSSVIDLLETHNPRPVTSDAVFGGLAENSIGLKGYVYCEIGGVDALGVYHPENIARSVIVGKGIKKISLNGQDGLKYVVYGNNSGLNNRTYAIIGSWTTGDFVNTTDYKYLIVTVAHTDEQTIFTDAPKMYVEFDSYAGVVSVSDISQNSNRPVSSGLFSDFVSNSAVKMNGLITCEIGSINMNGVKHPENTARALLVISGVKKVTLNGQADLKYAIYGNNMGVNFPIYAISDGWTTDDFVNDTEYGYIFVMVAHTDETIVFEGLPSLYVEFADYRGISSVSEDEQYISRPLSVGAFGEIMKDVGHRITSDPVKDMKRMSLVIIYGQSLSIGQDSVATSVSPSKYNNALMFSQGVRARVAAENMTRLVPLIEKTVETPARGLSEAFVETTQQENMFDEYSSLWGEKQLILACPGVGASTIDSLTNDSNYQYFENIITAAKNFCDDRGYVIDIPVWCWMQGENDIKARMDAATYKTKLLALQEKVCTSVYEIAGISDRPKCIVYQPNCQSLYKTGDTGVDNQFDFNYNYMGVQTAFMELVRDNSEFIASAPTYICDPCAETGGWWVHCDAKSYKLLGAMLGYNMKKYLVDGVSNKGVVPTNISVSGNTIKLKYNVPCPPLCFDTNYVREAPHMGFNVIKTDNSDIINNVSLFNDTVTIECSENPSGCKLRYGMNGDFIITSVYRGVSGREHGGRGNLRDCQGNYFYKEIEGCKYPLHNWAYTFEYLIS